MRGGCPRWRCRVAYWRRIGQDRYEELVTRTLDAQALPLMHADERTCLRQKMTDPVLLRIHIAAGVN